MPLLTIYYVALLTDVTRHNPVSRVRVSAILGESTRVVPQYVVGPYL
jgi:hypothetical protein